MVKIPKIERRGFIWIPPSGDIYSDVTIGGVSYITDGILSAKFTRALCPEIGDFKVELLNVEGTFNNLNENDEVILKIDRTDGTTQRFKGKIENLMNKNQDFDILEISGGHVSSELLDIMVTESYTGEESADEILKDLIDTYLTGYTYTNVNTSTEHPTINWNNKPFWDCVEDLCKVAKSGTRFDCYVDDDKDFHFFEQGSVENNDEAIVWDDNLIDIGEIGNRNVSTKNKITVQGEDATGFPIISTYGTGSKERIIADGSISSVSQADELSNAEYNTQSQSSLEGTVKCDMLPNLSPGDKIYITHPPSKILGQYVVFSYTHILPEEETEVVVQKKRNIPNIFKERLLKESALEKSSNPYRMTASWNFLFDDLSELSGYDSNITVSGSKLLLSSGTEGIATSTIKSTSTNVTKVHLLVKGEAFDTTEFHLYTSGSVSGSYQALTPNALNNLSYPGSELILQIRIRSSSTQIEGIAVLHD